MVDYNDLKNSEQLEFSIDSVSPILTHYKDIKFAIFNDFYIDKDLSDDLNYGEICDICNGVLEDEQERSKYKMVVLVPRPKFDGQQKQSNATGIFYKAI